MNVRAAIMAAGTALVLAWSPGASAQSGDNEFADGFGGSGGVDTSKWSTARFKQGRGWYEGYPYVADGRAYMSVGRYNANRDHGGFVQSDLRTRETFRPGTNNAVKAQARIRLTHNTGGVVHGFYFYNEFDTNGDDRADRSDEIDFEFLSNLTRNTNNPKILLSTWRNWDREDPVYGGFNDGGFHQSLESTSNRNATYWNWYEMYWQRGAVRFYRADQNKQNWQWLRTYTGTNKVPDRAMRLHLNSWVPDNTWTEAYNGGLTSTGNSGGQAWYTMEVDQVIVTKAPRR